MVYTVLSTILAIAFRAANDPDVQRLFENKARQATRQALRRTADYSKNKSRALNPKKNWRN